MSLQTDDAGNPVVHRRSEEGFVDLTFRIHDLINDGDRYRFHLAASYNNSVIGMGVDVVTGIQGGIDSNMKLIKEHVYRKGVRFCRSGEESDRLVTAIADLYGSSASPRKMVSEETFTAIALHRGDLDMSKVGVKLKLFGRDHEPLDEDAYYESFFNLDLSSGFVFWNEKDPSYRVPLLRALTAV